MELENKDYIPLEIYCPHCHHKAEYSVRMNTSQGKVDVYVCQHCDAIIRVPVKGASDD